MPLNNGTCPHALGVQGALGVHRLIAYGEDPVAVLAKQIICEQEASLPDLTHVTVLLNNPNRISELRRQLLATANAIGCNGLLGPTVCSLREYVAEHTSLEKPIIGDRARELMLYKALRQHQQLFGEVSTWHLTDNLLALFDELTANQYHIDDDNEVFTAALAAAYGLQPSDVIQAPVGREAKIVHTLWHAYHDELNACEHSDTETAYRQGLEQLIADNSDTTFYVAGYHRFLPSELAFLQSIDDRGQLRLLLHGQKHPAHKPNNAHLSRLHSDNTLHTLIERFDTKKTNLSTSYNNFLNTVFTPLPIDGEEQAGILQRAQLFTAQEPVSPAKPRLRLCKNHTPEHEAQAIALQLAHWRNDGKQRLAIITDDRRLARRVRALLQRFGLTVNDYTGWALSTTSAAAAIDSWLALIEQDFAYQPLLDLLKSPFALPDWDRETLSKAVYRFEQDIVRRENIQANLSRYRFTIRSRQQRLQWQDTLVTDLLDEVEHAAEPVIKLIKAKHKTSITDLLNAVELSMQRIGLMSTLQNDEAGHSIVEQLQTLHSLPEPQTVSLPWQEFRLWFARSLEQSYFQLSRVESGIALLPMTQSNLEQFDGLIIAAADAKHLPLKQSPSPLFNQAVRRELGLRTQTDELQTAFYHFRRLLESAPNLVITYSTENNGEPQTLAPWLQLVNAFHQLGYGDDLHDQVLAHAAANLVLSDVTGDELPDKPHMPAPAVNSKLLPDSYSAYSYQQLVNCPYRYFAGQCLQLSAPDAIREALQKADYGELVHRCLQALHSDVKGLAGPFPTQINDQSRQAAIDMLHTISQQVFAADLEDNYLHRVWLQRWCSNIPHYIDWQIKQGAAWHIHDNERYIEIEATESTFGLRGRIDRVDSNDEGDSIIDYKTGAAASVDDVMLGESVQLPFYVMLWHRPVTQCKYLQLGEPVKEVCIENEELADITEHNQQRLTKIHQQLRNGHDMHAWGDDSVCQYCEFQGVCRKQSWPEKPRNRLSD